MGELPRETVRAVKVRIIGREYTIRGHGNKEYVEELADFINEKAEEIRQRARVVSTVDILALTLLNVADELVQLKKLEQKKSRAREEDTEEP